MTISGENSLLMTCILSLKILSPVKCCFAMKNCVTTRKHPKGMEVGGGRRLYICILFPAISQFGLNGEKIMAAIFKPLSTSLSPPPASLRIWASVPVAKAETESIGEIRKF